jgi:hypothetical protein
MRGEALCKGGKVYSLSAMAKKKGVNAATLRRKAWRAGIKADNQAGIILISDEEFDFIWSVPGSSVEEVTKDA